MADEKKPEEKTPPPQITPFHKNPPVGPRTGKVQPDWNAFRDYENFNPTADK